MKKAPLTNKGQQGFQITIQHSYSSSLTAQRARLLKRLEEAPVTTIQARHQLDILAPAPRVYELRHNYGYNIVTYWQTQQTPEGHSHRVASYVLFPGKYVGRAN